MSESNSYLEHENKLNSNQFQHPLETKQPINEKTKEEETQNLQKKNSLFFNQKDISPMKLYCYLSRKLEFLFIILNFIGSICSGRPGIII